VAPRKNAIIKFIVAFKPKTISFFAVQFTKLNPVKNIQFLSKNAGRFELVRITFKKLIGLM
jgi:hypothetical protein